MERAEYERLAALDRRLWWFRGLHAQMAGALRRHGEWLSEERVLDAGCGTGGLLVSLRDRMPAIELFGIELAPIAAGVARSASGRRPRTGSRWSCTDTAESRKPRNSRRASADG